ncbi:30S ribosomal protein S9 [Candidatus Peregrinibacteria bacterium]|jgi:small subunit ribosomal protein S9|nr:30S ribosomal protein S9 [Candidatus Peregrinibacteria bacterium]MBT7736816.1 30S ribosomal protein S9 [Candidatus Peregrinibacteria bacterium]
MPTTKKTVKKEEKETPKKAAPKGKYTYANGKRKSAVARVRLYKGTGEITINDKTISEYVAVKALIGLIKSPFKLTGHVNKFDVSAKVDGGGVTAQAEAVRHGIVKSLIEADPLAKPVLKKAGLITRDSRTKERKKFGLKRARKAPQFSKR